MKSLSSLADPADEVDLGVSQLRVLVDYGRARDDARECQEVVRGDLITQRFQRERDDAAS